MVGLNHLQVLAFTLQWDEHKEAVARGCEKAIKRQKRFIEQFHAAIERDHPDLDSDGCLAIFADHMALAKDMHQHCKDLGIEPRQVKVQHLEGIMVALDGFYRDECYLRSKGWK